MCPVPRIVMLLSHSGLLLALAAGAADAAAADSLAEWMQKGTAAGNAGDHYDNRDGGHSPLQRFETFPVI